MSKYNRVIDSKFSQVIDPYDAQFGIRDVGKRIWRRGADDITKLIKKNRPRLSKSRVDTKSYTRAMPSGSPGDIVDVPVQSLPGDNGAVGRTTRLPRSNDLPSRRRQGLPQGRPGDIAPIKPDSSNVPTQLPGSRKSANVGDDFARANPKPRPLQSATPGDVIDVPTRPDSRSQAQSEIRRADMARRRARADARRRNRTESVDVPPKSLPSDDMDVMPTSRKEIHSPEAYEQAAARLRAEKAARRQNRTESVEIQTRPYSPSQSADRQAYKNRSRKAYGAGRQSEARGETWTNTASPAAARKQGWINPTSVGGAAAAAAGVGAGAYGFNRMTKKKNEEEEDGYEQG